MKCFKTILLFTTDTYILKSEYVNSLAYSNDIPPMSGELIGQFHDVHWDLWCEMDFSLYPVDKHVKACSCATTKTKPRRKVFVCSK